MNEKLVEIKKKADELKDLYNNYLKFKEQKFSYTNLETTDGVIYLDEGVELAIGVPVYKMDENGQVLVAEDGSYELTDGRTIEVVDGLVAEIADSKEEGVESPEETAAPDAPEAMASESPAGNVEDVSEGDGGIEERVMALESSMEKMMEMLQGIMSKQEEELTKVNQKMSKLFISAEDFNRESSKSESVSSKLSSGNIMADIKNYASMRGYKEGKKVESFGEVKNVEVADRVKELKEAMANARVSGGSNFGSLSITSGK